jgi:hypothetical protein
LGQASACRPQAAHAYLGAVIKCAATEEDTMNLNEGASGGGTYVYEGLTDTLFGGTYKGQLVLP